VRRAPAWERFPPVDPGPWTEPVGEDIPGPQPLAAGALALDTRGTVRYERPPSLLRASRCRVLIMQPKALGVKPRGATQGRTPGPEPPRAGRTPSPPRRVVIGSPSPLDGARASHSLQQPLPFPTNFNNLSRSSEKSVRFSELLCYNRRCRRYVVPGGCRTCPGSMPSQPVSTGFLRRPCLSTRGNLRAHPDAPAHRGDRPLFLRKTTTSQPSKQTSPGPPPTGGTDLCFRGKKDHLISAGTDIGSRASGPRAPIDTAPGQLLSSPLQLEPRPGGGRRGRRRRAARAVSPHRRGIDGAQT
jgi:hypothetical protein